MERNVEIDKFQFIEQLNNYFEILMTAEMLLLGFFISEEVQNDISKNAIQL
jgi:hypothetical protein